MVEEEEAEVGYLEFQVAEKISSIRQCASYPVISRTQAFGILDINALNTYIKTILGVIHKNVTNKFFSPHESQSSMPSP